MSIRTQPGQIRTVGIDFTGDPGYTEQAHKDEVDIHNIMRKYEKTGVIKHNAAFEGQYMDMTGALDYTDAQNLIAEGKSMFETVPSGIRQDFDNDSSKFVDFMQDENNRSQIEAYGFTTTHLPPVVEQEAPPPPPTPPTDS